MRQLLCVLHNWQDLSGAIIGGLLGVIGALIVARSALSRERRNASRMLQRDLINVTGMVNSLTHHRKIGLPEVGPDTLARHLKFYRYQLSPMFEAQMVIVVGIDVLLAGLLIGFHQSYDAVESHMRKIEGLPQSDPDFERAREALVGVLQYTDNYANAALYLLPLLEMGIARRVVERIRRLCRPTDSDKAMQKLVEKMVAVKA
jgi:hypothetical protein